MTKLYRSLIAIALSFMCAFVTIGYAAVTTELAINGTATIAAPDGVIITKVEVVDTSTGEVISSGHFQDILSSKIEVTGDQSVTFRVTVQNFSNEVQYYNTTYIPDTQFSDDVGWEHTLVKASKNANTGAVDANSTILAPAGKQIDINGEEVESGGVRTDTTTFEITIKNGAENPSTTDAATLESHIKIEFVPKDEFTFGQGSITSGNMLSGALGQFLEILNSKDPAKDADGNVITDANGNALTKYDVLDNFLTTEADGANQDSDRGPYVGNVVGATDEAEKLLSGLFGDKLSITVDGTPSKVTVMIKQQNIDGKPDEDGNGDYTGNSFDYRVNEGSYFRPNYVNYTAFGCEMTLYITADQFYDADGNTLINIGDDVNVYVAVFTCPDANKDGIPDGDWYMLGDMYKGIAEANDYNQSFWNPQTGSFNTGSWRSVEQTSNTYGYTLTSGLTIETLIQSTTADSGVRNKLADLITSARTLAENLGIMKDGAFIEGATDTTFANAYNNAVAMLNTMDTNGVTSVTLTNAIAVMNELMEQIDLAS